MSSNQQICRGVCVVLLGAGIGCGGGQEPGATAPTSSPSATTATAATSTAATPASAIKTPIAIPDEGDPANHYLGADIVFAANQAYVNGTNYCYPAKLLAEPAGTEAKAKLWNFVSKKEMETQHFWRTHKAKPDEIVVGKIALMAHRKGSERLYVPPSSVTEAYTERWWMARIISTRSRDDGYVVVSGAYRIKPDAIRMLEGDGSPALGKQGAEDEHFIGEEHWFVGNAAMPKKGNRYVYPGLPLKPDKPFDGGEGRFLQLPGGKIVLTAHAWQTRRATKADWKKGQRVVIPDYKDGKKYRAPKTRVEAVSRRWWSVLIEEVSGDTLKVEGGYEVAADATRVIKK